jgi:predicted DNA-binding transcriptional regulator YafY
MTYFMGMTGSEVAELLQVSVKTVRRDLASCTMWIGRDIGSTKPPDA